MGGRGPQRAGAEVCNPRSGSSDASPSTGPPRCLGLLSSPHSTQQQAQKGRGVNGPQPPYSSLSNPFQLPCTVSEFPTTWFLNPPFPNPSALTLERLNGIPQPVGALPSSSTPFLPGLKCNSRGTAPPTRDLGHHQRKEVGEAEYGGGRPGRDDGETQEVTSSQGGLRVSASHPPLQ